MRKASSTQKPQAEILWSLFSLPLMLFVELEWATDIDRQVGLPHLIAGGDCRTPPSAPWGNGMRSCERSGLCAAATVAKWHLELQGSKGKKSKAKG